MEKNLFVKLMDRLSATKSNLNSTVKKRIGALAIASTLGLSTLSLSSCDLLNQFINPDNSTNSSSTINPGNSSSGGSTNSKYSKLLQNILNDNEINALIDRANNDVNLFKTAEFDPHPYDFLKDHGHNVKAIKSGELACNTSTYIKDSEPNNLYMMTYVETKANTPYYTEYLLKYTLTDQEISDYKFLHYGNYLQAVFINNEISETRPATIVSQAKISVKAHENFQETLENHPTIIKDISHKYIDIMLKDYSAADNTFDLYIFPRSIDTSMTCRANIGTFPMKGSNAMVKEDNGVFVSPSTGSFGQSFTNGSYSSFLESLEPITLFSSEENIMRKYILNNDQ